MGGGRFEWLFGFTELDHPTGNRAGRADCGRGNAGPPLAVRVEKPTRFPAYRPHACVWYLVYSFY